MILWYTLGLICFLVIICELYALKTGVPTVTSFPSARRKMIEILKEEVARNNASSFGILDLGSGTGKLALETGRALASARVTGIEISIVPFLLSLIRRYVWGVLWKVRNVEFVREDFWRYDISQTDAVIIYINGAIYERMGVKLKKELRPGALVISNEVHFPNWTPVSTHEAGILKSKIVVYRQS